MTDPLPRLCGACRKWPVVPVGTDKLPLLKAWPDRASVDEDEQRAWLHRWPRAALAVHLGGAGIICLDIEGTAGGAHATSGETAFSELLERLGPLPQTAIGTTPSGGRHLLFQDPGGLRSRVIAPGIEIRAGTALAVLPLEGRTPGRCWIHHPDTGVAVLPVVWTGALRPPPPPPPGPPIRIDHRTGRYARAALDDELRRLAGTVEGGRNHALHASAVRLGSLVGAGLLDGQAVADLLELTAREMGLHPKEALPTIRSGMAYGAAHPREVA
ncbi:bifunctional DNA primase/polymerase [Geminicoccus flavidas]|uniref:bifunctional DNA primase/polymerase n=1 Tax=Geminicoccus flavidas TaxID=2506407 RepID=UPI00135A376B|nr:bifunctional DNA primase/polymerase [Geminicoccus flavidas]